MNPSRVSLEYATPAADLREFISSYYLFDFDHPDFRDTERADRPQLRFMFRGAGGYRFRDGHVMPAHRVTIVGPTTGPSEGFSSDPLTIFGAGLQPAGWAAMMGADAPNHVDRLLAATEIFGPPIHDLHARLKAAGGIAEMAAIMDHAARALLDRADQAALRFTRLVDAWLTETASPRLDELIAASGLSQRQLERMTKRHYGVSPKLLARKYRALRAASALASGDADGLVSTTDGFYDQSHLIREIKHFTGVTPGEMRDNAPMLTRATMGGRKGLSGRVGPLVSDT